MTQPTSAVPPAQIPPAPIQTPAQARRPKKAPAESNVKETLEQILVAFILAFIFRCFIVEAYVIPTGSMAPTLLGAHMNFRCPDCGWHWTVNYSGDNGGEVVPNVASETYPIRCPNCGYKVPRELAGEPDNDATRPPVAYGDRILVQKYIYLLHEPRRWDVVVFKTPDNSSTSVEPFTQNYIKRLIGSPGETVMVLDGDVYIAPAKQKLDDYKPEDFVIQSKPFQVQEAMWRIIYDNDHLPRGMPRTYGKPGTQYTSSVVELSESKWAQPWTPDGSGWDVSGRVFRFEGADKTEKIIFDPSVPEEKHAMTDWLAYDVSQGIDETTRNSKPPILDFFTYRRYMSINNVADLKLALTYSRKAGNGPLRLNLTRHGYRFTAELTPGSVRLLKLAPDSSTEVEIGKAALPSAGRPIRAEFANVDFRVSVRIDGTELLASTPADFKPDVAKLLADYNARNDQAAGTASIEASRQTAEISHLSLWRDVYYLNRESHPGAPLRWAMPDGFPMGLDYPGEKRRRDDPIPRSQLMKLGDDEFFVMGDNSLMSSDARYWDNKISLPYEDINVEGGRVPRRFMLGRAFFVYWPAGYAPYSGFPVRMVPNFGEMRFIH